MPDIPCLHCNGTGRIKTGGCAALVGDRPCKKMWKDDPAYFSRHPNRAHLRIYCPFHRNWLVRQKIVPKEMHVDAPGTD